MNVEERERELSSREKVCAGSSGVHERSYALCVCVDDIIPKCPHVLNLRMRPAINRERQHLRHMSAHTTMHSRAAYTKRHSKIRGAPRRFDILLLSYVGRDAIGTLGIARYREDLPVGLVADV